MKKYLLMAGDSYYPSGGTGDWIGCYESYDEAHKQVTITEHKRVITRGKLKGQEEVTHSTYTIGERGYDWYEIEDLENWINAKN